jgi:hypothetical protein
MIFEMANEFKSAKEFEMVSGVKYFIIRDKPV